MLVGGLTVGVIVIASPRNTVAPSDEGRARLVRHGQDAIAGAFDETHDIGRTNAELLVGTYP